MKAFSGADRLNSLHNRHALAQREPLKKGSVGRVCPIPPRKPGWNGMSQQIRDLADICPNARICPPKQRGPVTKVA